MKKIILGSWFLAFLIFFAVSLVEARPAKGPAPAPQDRIFMDANLPWIAEELDLNKKQVQEIKRLNRQCRKKSRFFRQKMHPLLDSLRFELEKEVVQTEKVRKILLKISSLRVDLQMLHIEKMEKIKKILSKEQLAELKEIEIEHRHHHGREGGQQQNDGPRKCFDDHQASWRWEEGRD